MANLGASWSHFLAVTDDHGVNAAIGVQNTSGKSEGELVTLFWQWLKMVFFCIIFAFYYFSIFFIFCIYSSHVSIFTILNDSYPTLAPPQSILFRWWRTAIVKCVLSQFAKNSHNSLAQFFLFSRHTVQWYFPWVAIDLLAVVTYAIHRAWSLEVSSITNNISSAACFQISRLDLNEELIKRNVNLFFSKAKHL